MWKLPKFKCDFLSDFQTFYRKYWNLLGHPVWRSLVFWHKFPLKANFGCPLMTQIFCVLIRTFPSKRRTIPKIYPTFSFLFAKPNPFFAGDTKKKSFFLLAVNWISPFLCSCNINEGELSSSYSVIWHTLILLFLDWKKLFHPDDAFIAILPF